MLITLLFVGDAFYLGIYYFTVKMIYTLLVLNVVMFVVTVQQLMIKSLNEKQYDFEMTS